MTSTEIRKLIAELEVRDLLTRACSVAVGYHVTVPELLDTNRFRPAEHARAELWWTLFADGAWTYARLGKLFRRDRSTIQKGVQAHQTRLDARLSKLEVPAFGAPYNLEMQARGRMQA